MELERIHSRLKVAVKAHQMVVAKMKTDTEHTDLQRTLHELQSEIRSLSDQQMVTVHQLRQEILALQGGSPGLQMLVDRSSSQPASSQPVLFQPVSTAESLSSSVVDSSVCQSLQANRTSAASVTYCNPDAAVSSMPAGSALQVDPSTGVCSLPCGSDTDVKCNISDISVDVAKLEFMACLQLITLNSLKELQSRKQLEQKRRVNIHHSISYGQFQPEMEMREDCCSVCRRSGELLMCDVCSLVYHLQCLDPPLSAVPVGLWSCPKCQALGKLCGGKDDWPGTLALVHSYLTHKAAREEEKLKEKKQNEALVAERKCLELRAAQLAESLAQRLQQKNELLNSCTVAEKNYDNLRNFVLQINSV